MYLWFLPVAIWVGIPLALRAVGLSLQLANQLLFIRNSGQNTVKPQAAENQRRYARFETSPITVKVSDGDLSCGATLRNISRLGIGLKNLPEKLFSRAERLTVIIKEKEQNPHTLRVQPVWATADASGQNIGARIITASSEWLDFLQHYRRNTSLGLP
jgi:hypothetical protein